MANRSITLDLKANVDSYVAGMKKAKTATDDMAKAAQESSKKVDASVSKAGDTKQMTSRFGAAAAVTKKHFGEMAKSVDDFVGKNAAAMETVGGAMAGFGGVLVAGFAGAVKTAADFDAAMSSVRAATLETDENMAKLGEAAKRAGADTAFSAVEAAQGIEELAKAGVDTTDIINGGLDGALALAAAGGLEVGDAAEIAASAMTQFKLEGEKVPHVADLLAAGAGKAQGGVKELGDALAQSGLVAAQTGLDIEETTGTLSAFASAGLIGSDAGTSFKTMLQRLNPQSKAAATLMDQLGLSAYDSQGNFIGMAEYAGKLQGALSGMSEQQRAATMNTLFGSDAIRAASVLYEQGEDGIRKWTEAVDDSGYAAKTAAAMQDNLRGDLEKLGGSIETVFLEAGTGANDALREIVQGLEDFVDSIGQVPTPILKAAAGFAGLVGGAALLGGAIITVLPRIRDTRDAFRDLVPAGSKAEGAIKSLGKTAGIVSLAIAGLSLVGEWITDEDEASVETLGQAILQVGEDAETAKEKGAGLDKAFKEWSTVAGQSRTGIEDLHGAVSLIANPSLGDEINKNLNFMNGWFSLPDDKLTETTKRFKDLSDQMGQMATSGHTEEAAAGFRELVSAFEEQGVSADEVFNKFPGYRDALQGLANDLGVPVSEAELLEWALSGIPPEAVAAAEAAKAAGGDLEGLGVAAGEAADGVNAAGDAIEGMAGMDLSGMSAMEQAWVTQREEARATAEAMQEAEQTLEDLLDGMKAAAGETLALPKAMGQYREALAGVSAALQENGRTMDATTDAGLKNHEAVAAIVEATYDMAGSMATAGESQAALSTHLQKGWQDAVTSAQKLGMTRDAAEKLANEMFGIPPGVSIKTEMDSQALEVAEMTGTALADLPGTKTIDVVVDDQGNTIGTIAQRIDGVTGQKSIEFIASDTGETVAAIAKTVTDVSGVPHTVYVRADDQGTILHTQQSLEGLTDQQVDVYAEAVTEQADLELETVARGRQATVTALAFVDEAEGWLTHAARDRIQNTFTTPFTDIAEAQFNQTARDRVQDTTTSAHTDAAEGLFNVAARARTQDSTAVAHTRGAESDLNYVVRHRTAPVTAVASTLDARIMLDALKAPIRTPINAYVNSVSNPSGLGVGTVLKRAEGGRIGRYATGGRLPYTGLGTDMILGVSKQGMPVARVDDGEWIIKERSARKYNPLLAAINRDDPSVQPLAGYAAGGLHSMAEARRYSMPATPSPAAGSAHGAAVQADPKMLAQLVSSAVAVEVRGHLDGARVVLDGRQTVGALRLANTR